MILELKDITGDEAVGSIDVPDGVTLGQFFDNDERLRAIAKLFINHHINGTRVSDWRGYAPRHGDKLQVTLMPGEIASLTAFLVGLGVTASTAATISTVVGVLAAVLTIASLGSFVASLFMQPKTPKIDVGDRPSPTYSWDGIQNTSVPGNPIPVIYGQHRVGGQLLSMAVDVASSGLHQTLSVLLGLGEGLITSVNCVQINDIAIENFADVSTWYWAAGYTSQAALSYFEKSRNTYADGREISSEAIIYATVAPIKRAQIQITAAQGLGHHAGGTHIRLLAAFVMYSMEWRVTGTTTWTSVQTRTFVGRTRSERYDVPEIDFGSLSLWDLRLRWLKGTQPRADTDKGDQVMHRIWLKGVTEIPDDVQVFSGVAQLAVRGVATAQLQGGRPKITSLVRGRAVDCYLSPSTFVNTWTRNPAWCILDYATNSIYGAGAQMPIADHNIQSWIDFATLCNSLVPDGLGDTEPQHYLDRVIDQRKPHLDHIQSLLSNYKSALLWSDGQWKVISDRADLPVRQVFHAGNMIPERTNVAFARDDLNPNQVNLTFADQNTGHELNTIYAADSASVLGAGDPIVDFDLSLVGVTRESEVLRSGEWRLQRRRETRREISFATGLEAIAVEPGDMARVGFITTDFEAGYGGRAVDGSSHHIVLDREVTINSGYTYDLFIKHLDADTIETRVVSGALYNRKTVTVSPTAAFSLQVKPGDVYALGINSEDLFLARVKSVKRDHSTGVHEIVAEEFIRRNPITPTLTSTAQLFDLNAPPPQPISVVGTLAYSVLQDGGVVAMTFIEVTPPLPTEGGQLTNPGTTASITLGGSHTPVNDALNQDAIRMISGVASGYQGTIGKWNAGTQVASMIPNFSTVPVSGDSYMLMHRGGEFAGFDIYSGTSGSAYGFMATNLGTVAEFPASPDSADLRFKIIPFSTRGVRNTVGCWEITINPLGDTTAPNTPTGLAATVGTGKLVRLHWAANSEADVAEYRIYRHTSNAFGTSSLIAEVSVNEFNDSNVVLGTPYFYWLRAVDRSENISPIHPGSTAGVTATPVLVAGTEVSTAAPTALSSLTVNFPATYLAADGTAYTQAQMFWVNPADTAREFIDVLYKRNSSTNSEWVLANQTRTSSSQIDDLSIGVYYDFAVRPVSKFGVRGGLTVVQSSRALDTTAPGTPSGLLAAIGTGRQVVLDWSDNTESDLSYYEVYRHTSNAFGSAAKIANVALSRFTDVVSAFETAQFYWIRAADRSGNLSPVHPGSTNGVTITASRLITLDVTSDAITSRMEFANDASIGFTQETIIASTGYASRGGELLIIGKCDLENDSAAGDKRCTIRLRVDSIGGTILDQSAVSFALADDHSNVALHKIFSPASGSSRNYLLTGQPETADLVTATFRRLHILEIRR